MARSIWSGSIGFGLVNIPVKLYKARDSGLAFRNVHMVGHAPVGINLKKWCGVCNREVTQDELVKAYEYDGKFIVFSQDEIDDALPGASKTIKIKRYVNNSELTPLVVDEVYFLAPDKGAEHPYALLQKAMAQDKTLIGEFVMREKGHQVMIRPFQHGMLLTTMYYKDEIRDIGSVINPDVVTKAVLSPDEIQLAQLLLSKMEGNFADVEQIDEFKAKIIQMAQTKAAGGVVSKAAAPAAAAPVSDLMTQLRASVGLGAGFEVPKPPQAVTVVTSPTEVKTEVAPTGGFREDANPLTGKSEQHVKATRKRKVKDIATQQVIQG